MGSRSCAAPDAGCGAARGTCEGPENEGKTGARSAKVNDRVSFRHRSGSGQGRSTISVVGIVLQGLLLGFFLALHGPAVAAPEPPALVVGSKRFTESYVLGEIVTQTLVAAGRPALHRQGLGNTGILEQALASGAVDVYPEYTGTIVRELLKRDGNPSLAELNRWLAPRGLVAAVPFGFNNTYALAMSEARAKSLGIARISDLASAQARELKLGLSHEFLQRADGWPALRQAYALAATPVGLDHGLAYDAVAAGRVDVIDVYSTDAKLGRLGLRVLEDDRAFFPKYDAVLLMRAGVDPRPLQPLAGAIDAATMIALNGEVELDGRSFAETAAKFLAARGIAGAASGAVGTTGSARPASADRQGLLARLFAPDLGRLAVEHLLLVFGSLLVAVVVGVPVGIAAWRWPKAAGLLLGVVAILQTVPSLALLAFLIALVGSIGIVPALIALFLYALLPIVRNTHAGLQGGSREMAQAALSLGLTPPQALRHVQLPLAAPTILAGVKTAAVINVGTATMAAFIGAGGFGERIVAGLAVNDSTVMLAGALPAAALAIVVQVGFDAAERWATGGRDSGRD
ncbi:MAG: ABC transporter permease subunit [Burkholderiales bacterium]|nr:ABC transporter permease subunit [Burkholderiales bacterium]